MNKINFKTLEEDYLYLEDGILYNTTDYIKLKIKQLPESERRIILLYIELGSYRKVAKIFNASHTKISYIIKKIIAKITK